MKEFYIGQIFENEFPKEASDWCNMNNAYIKEIEPVESVRKFEIVEQEKYIPTFEDVDKCRIQYRKEHIDDKTIARMRKIANGSWTEEDEQAYLDLDNEVTAWIEQNLPYPVE